MLGMGPQHTMATAERLYISVRPRSQCCHQCCALGSLCLGSSPVHVHVLGRRSHPAEGTRPAW